MAARSFRVALHRLPRRRNGCRACRPVNYGLTALNCVPSFFFEESNVLDQQFGELLL